MSNLLRRPVLLFHERVDEVRDEIRHDAEVLRDDIQHRARRLEVTVAAWGITAALLVVCGLFALMGLWFGLSAYIGPVGASFALAALFGSLAAVPVAILPQELTRLDGPHPSRSK
jgi:uncharacterized membrane protein